MDSVDEGDVLALVHHRGSRGLDSALERLHRATQIRDKADELPLLIEVITPSA